MKLFLFSLFYIFVSASLLGNEFKDAEEIVRGNPFNLTEEDFKQKYAEKYDISLDEPELWVTTFRYIKIFNHKARLVKFSFPEGKNLASIKLFLDHPSQEPGYEALEARNLKILNDLRKKYGNPKVAEIFYDMSIYVKWINADGMDITYHAKVLKDSVRSSYCTLEFAKPGTPSKTPDLLLEPRDELMGTICRYIFSLYEANKKNLVNPDKIVKFLKNYKPKNINVNNKFVVNYGSYKYEINVENLFRSGILAAALNRQKKPDSYLQAEVYTKDGKIALVKNILNSKKNGRTINDTTFYEYQEGFLKIIHREGEFSKDQYWLDFDDRGYLSRVIRVKNNIFNDIYYIYAEKNYRYYIVLKVDVLTGRPLKFKLKSGVHSLGNKCHEDHSIKNNEFSVERFFVDSFYNELIAKNIASFLPNVQDEKFVPKIKVNSDFLKPSIKFYGELLEYDNKLGRQIVKDSKKILKAKNPFKEMAKDIVIVLRKEAGKEFPFVINKVAKTAVQLKLENGRLFTLFKGKTVLGYLQLVKITDEAAEFININTKQPKVMKIGEVHKGDDSYFVSYKGQTHQLRNGENFMGSAFLVENNSFGFLNKGKLIRPDSAICELSGINPAAGTHKISNCNCYEDPFDKQLNGFSRDDIRQAKMARINDKYLFKNCNFEVLEQKRERKNPRTGKDIISLGVFTGSENKISPFHVGEIITELKFSTRNQELRINGKSLKKVPSYMSDRTEHLLSFGKDHAVSVLYIPKNPWVLKRLIENFSVRMNGRIYMFKTSTITYRSRDDIPFAYTVDPEKNEITIDGAKYEISFEKNGIYLISKVSEKFNLYLKHESDLTLLNR